jgi:hypothetical protein
MIDELETYTIDTQSEAFLAAQKRHRIITRLSAIEEAAKSSSYLLTPGLERTLFAMIGHLTQIIREELVE